MRLCLSFYFFLKARLGLVGSVVGELRVLKKPGDGKNMYSVFEGFFPVPMCILRPNQVKWLERRVT